MDDLKLTQKQQKKNWEQESIDELNKSPLQQHVKKLMEEAKEYPTTSLLYLTQAAQMGMDEEKWKLSEELEQYLPCLTEWGPQGQLKLLLNPSRDEDNEEEIMAEATENLLKSRTLTKLVEKLLDSLEEYATDWDR